MKYEKPQVLVSASAVEAVCSGTTKGNQGVDAHGCSEPPFATASAYEADE